jgi:hypothetical protein
MDQYNLEPDWLLFQQGKQKFPNQNPEISGNFYPV